ncbi:hypothetical protein llap_5281 [Limosa lapponica baueri]|uniref:Uncharacterized protein n=1 Tax=Limosa lapponica baueri TaxID=1758121 RepID=A0A2I0UEC9_LIMLA|nr:hypothetical protein llap_5281 [Limosa lapponica baueri]
MALGAEACGAAVREDVRDGCLAMARLPRMDIPVAVVPSASVGNRKSNENELDCLYWESTGNNLLPVSPPYAVKP